MKTLTNNKLSVKIKSCGAELTSIKNNKTSEEYLWQADPKFWGRQSPVLFPIVGSVWNKQYRHEGKTYELPQHGFARDCEFQLVSEKENEVRYRLVSNADTLKVYPFDFELEIGYKLTDNQLEVIWVVKNTGNTDMYFQIGAHPAFNYPDFNVKDELKGFFRFDSDKDLDCTLLGEKGCIAPGKMAIKQTDGLLPINKQTFDIDTILLENSQVTETALLDKHKQPYITVRYTAPVVGLWSPSPDAPFVCIEPWYGRCDRENYEGEYKDKDWTEHLASGKSFEASYTMEFNSL